MSFAFKRLSPKAVASTVAFASTAYIGSSYYSQVNSTQSVLANESKISATLPKLLQSKPAPPSRSQLISNLKTTPEYDVLIIGGGATGSGAAVDAATRGLKVALLERNDFASGTSSKSTKMAHGGVRYLEKAFWQLSKAQLDLVIEALNERGNMFKAAPHLVTVLPILIPVYKLWQVPYFYVGTKMYDFFAGKQGIRSAYLLGPSSTIEHCPQLDDKNLKAGLVYHDGSFNDARLNSTLALTAVENGATVLNYFEVVQLLKSADNKVEGVIAKDLETGEDVKIKAKSVINATGPYSDVILNMDKAVDGVASKDATTPRMVVPSAGVHVVLPEYYCPKDMGILDAQTSDGRVMFFLPWQGKVLAGTTDVPLNKIPENPTPTEADIEDILHELQHYIKFPVRREDVLSAWAGIRPLVRDPRTIKEGEKSGTQNLVRNHLLFTSETGLTTISGGKWTTYREMAQETVDEAVKVHNLTDKKSVTKDVVLAGGENFESTLAPRLVQKYEVPFKLAEHLASNYGTRAPLILEIFKQDKFNQLPVCLASASSKELSTSVSYDSFDFPFSVAELKYSINYEYTRSATDFLARRTRLAFLDAKAALKSVDGVVKVMGDELKWDTRKRSEEIQKTTEFLKTFA